MTTRTPLPTRRPLETQTCEHAGVRIEIGIGTYTDSRPGEIWFDSQKPGSDIDFLCRDAATILSVALQHGVPPQAFTRSLARDARGRPATLIGRMCAVLAREG